MSTSSTSTKSEELERSSIVAAIASCRFEAAASYAFSVMQHQGGSPEPRVKSERKDWLRHVTREGPRKFGLTYVLDFTYFSALQDSIRSIIQNANVDMVIRSAGSEVCAQLRLAMGLRYLAGGQVWDIQSNFLISVSEFYRSLWKSIDAINSI